MIFPSLKNVFFLLKKLYSRRKQSKNVYIIFKYMNIFFPSEEGEFIHLK